MLLPKPAAPLVVATWLAALVVAGWHGTVQPADRGDNDDAADDDDGAAGDDTGGDVEDVPSPGAPWTREEIAAPASITFTELHYHPSSSDDLEWIELTNPMVLDMDLSGWALEGAVTYAFPEGTVLAAGGYLVVAADPFLLEESTGFAQALGPWEGRLSDGGERLDLRSNGGRLVDTVEYGDDDPWPVGADGSGLSLAKINADAASDHAEHWSTSAVMGGTPGASNQLDPLEPPTTLVLVAEDATWTYALSGGYPAADWAEPDFDDGGWDEGEAPFFAGEAATGVAATAWATADNDFALYLGQADGSDLRLVGEDSDGSWTSVEEIDLEVGPRDHLYLAAWELTGDSASPQMLIAEVDLPDEVVGTDASTWEWVLGPSGANPGALPANAPPTEAALAALVEDAETAGSWEPPGVEATRGSSPWGGTVGGWFSDAASFVWADAFDTDSVTNSEDTYALFRTVDPLAGPSGTTELAEIPTTTLFRTAFSFDADPAATALHLDCELDDGAVVYLNGVEVLRENMPSGSVDAATLAADEGPVGVSADVSAESLLRGSNLLAAEVHQAEVDDSDLAFGCTLVAEVCADTVSPSVLLNEVAAAGDSPFWVELIGVGASAEDTGGFVLATSSGQEQVLPAGTLAPGDLLLLDDLDLAADAGEVLFLYSAGRSALLDAVRLRGWVRARDEDGGPWRVPVEATPGADNRVELTEDVVLNEIQYHRAPLSREGEPVTPRSEEWIELYNRGDAPVDLGVWQLVDAVALQFPEGTLLAPDAYLVVANDAVALAAEHPGVDVLGDFSGHLGNDGDRVLLLDADGNPADEVRYLDGGRWPAAAGGGGSSLDLRDPRADNAAAEAWAASDESGHAGWVSVSYRGVAIPVAARPGWASFSSLPPRFRSGGRHGAPAARRSTEEVANPPARLRGRYLTGRSTWLAEPSAVGPDGAWEELVVGLLDAGEVLIDDLSVIRDRDADAVEVLQDGSFDGGGESWRLLGDHRHSEVVPDPDDPSNPVLRLVATGAAGHMHNHAETTLVEPIRTTEYAISFRARWVSGSNQLNTRLYFNRLPRTTLVEQPDRSGTPGEPNSTLTDNLGPTFADLGQDPAVPDPDEPVVVEVSVDDPDGLAAVTLWSSADGGAFEAQAMVEGQPGRWSGSLEGQGGGAVVQFYVEATDGLGATATFPAAGPDSRALVGWDGGGASTTGLHALRIVMTEADSDWLHDEVNLMSHDLVGATVVWDEAEVFRDVGVRLKGSERGRPTAARLGYGIGFQDDQPFRGSHKSVLVDRSEGVGFGQREVLINLVMTHAGFVAGEYNDLVQLIAPRSAYTGSAELQLDRFTDLVLASQFADGDAGTRYEYELIYYPLTTDDGTDEGYKLPQPDSVIGTSITDLGDDREDYRHNFLIANNLREDDYDPLIGMCQAFALPDDEFLAAADEVLDVDEWLRAFAFATLSGATDQYGGAGSQHNAQFYQRPEDGRMLYFPHDLDYFGSSSMAVVGNTDLSRLLDDPGNRRSYYGHLADIIERAHTTDYLQPWCDQLGELLPDQDFDSNCAFVDARADWVSSGSSESRPPDLPLA